MVYTFIDLPFVRPGVLRFFGQDSKINTPEVAEVEKVARIGTGIGGIGGLEVGRVNTESLKGCASALNYWLAK